MIFRKVMLLAFVLSVVISGGRASAQPTITGLNTTVFSPTNDPFLTWNISFNEAVTGVSPANFTVAGTGVSATISSVTPLPGNTSWNISVNGITGDGTLGLNLTDPAGISGPSGPLTQTYTGAVYTVDNTSPYVVSIDRLDPSPTLATSVDFQINFSEPIYNLTTANFAPGGTPIATVSDISATTDPAVWTGTISGISGSGLLSLDLNDTSAVSDLAGNWLFSDYTAGEQYEIPPQLLCISRLDAEITSATAVRYNIEFNVPVSGLTAANFTATGPGGPITDITVASASGTVPTTDWIVTVGSISGDGIVQLAIQDPASIQDTSGVSAINVNPLNCNETIYQVDQSAPAAACVVIDTPASNATPTSATVVRFAVQFSDPVTGVSEDNFAITTTDLTAYTTGTWVTDDAGITWTLEITGISEDTTNAINGQIAVSWANTNGIIDIAGNQPAMPAGCTPAYYDIDQRGAVLDCVSREPAGIDEVTSASQISFRATFSEAVQTSSVSAADFRVIFAPATGLLSADVTTVTAVSTGTYSQQFIIELDNIVGNNALTPPVPYNAGQSLGNGELSLRLAVDAEIWDVAGNDVQLMADLAASCGNTSYTLDQLNPLVTAIDFVNGDCLTSGIFTLEFSEEVTTVSASDMEVLWNGGDCKGTFTITQALRTGPATFDVEVEGDSPLFHQNGPGEIGLSLSANDAIRDVAGNPLTTDFEGDLTYFCRCFEPAVTTSPLAVLVDTLRYPDLTTGTGVICAETDHCTSVGSLTAPYDDTPTTTSKPDVFAWNATEWDCNSTAPFALYLDEQLTTVTDGNTSLALATQLPPGTTNSLCTPIGTAFHHMTTATLSPGLHSFRVDILGACTSGTKMFFNVLDPPKPRFPIGGISTCRQPRVFGWEATPGALGYDVFFVDGVTSCSHLVGRTSETQLIVAEDLVTTAGEYKWYVQAFNKYGHIASERSTFTLLNGVDAAVPNVFQTDGTIYDMHVTSNTTYLAGSFSLVKVNGGNHPASNLAAIDNITSTVLPMPVVNNTIYTIEADGYDLYIGGDFTRITNAGETSHTEVARIARLELNTSSTLVTSGSMRLDAQFMPGANDTVRAIEVVDNTVYYGGDFTKVGTQIYNFGNFDDQVDAIRLATASTTMTAELTPPPASAGVDPNATVYDLLASDGYLYIAGAFSSIANKDIHGLARTTIKATGELDLGFDLSINADVSHYVYSMIMLDDRLYFGGSFASVMGEPRRNAANIDISATTSTVNLGTWDPQPHGGVTELASLNDGVVYIGGTFTSMRNERFTYLAAVDSVIGYPLSCAFNADRVIHAVEFWTNIISGNTNIQVGGAATSAGL